MIPFTAEPQQLKQLALFFDKDFSADNQPFLRKLSYCLARGSCYVLGADSVEGAVIVDSDLLGSDRVVAIQATEATACKALLLHALQNCSSASLFIELPPEGSPLSEAAAQVGFSPCGELKVDSSPGPVTLLSAPATSTS